MKANDTTQLIRQRRKGNSMTDEVPECDTCDRMLKNACITAELSERQRRFLDAYQQDLAIAPAARMAKVHRSTVYRWRENAAFVEAMRVAAQSYFREHLAKVLAENQARARWRKQRELDRLPMRCYHLERARQARRQKRQ